MPRFTVTSLRPLTILLLGLLLQACAGSRTGSQQVAGNDSPAGVATGTTVAASPVIRRSPPTEEGDPIESFNRKVFNFNLTVDDAAIRPVAEFYRDNIGAWTRTRIRNVIRNIEEPRYFVNNLLQGQPVAAGTTLMRFFINSTFGLAGMFDMSQIGGPPRQERNFGETLYVWGLPTGPFLMLPILGPSDARDTVGTVADGFMNPLTWLMPFYGNFTRGVVSGVDLRAENIDSFDALRSSSLDFYARLRSVWQQHRAGELRAVTGEETPIETPDPDMLEDPGATR